MVPPSVAGKESKKHADAGERRAHSLAERLEKMNDMMARMTPMTAMILPMWADSLAIPVNPKTAATMAMMKKTAAQ
jgi:hypothetical protein